MTRRTHKSWLLGVLAVAGCSDGPGTRGDGGTLDAGADAGAGTLDDLVAAHCDAVATCQRAPAGWDEIAYFLRDGETCRRVVAANARWLLVPDLYAHALGCARLNPSGVPACAAAIRAAGCPVGRGSLGACRAAFEPTERLAPGAPCDPGCDLQCPDGHGCFVPDTTCGGVRRCSPLRGAGAPCDYDWTCASGLCVSPGATAGTCAASVTQTRAATGAPCGLLSGAAADAVIAKCGDDAYCDGGICVAAPASGEACRLGYCPRGETCARFATDPVCKPPVLAAEGAFCGLGFDVVCDLAAGLACIGVTCQPIPAGVAGDVCDGTGALRDECAPGLYCPREVSPDAPAACAPLFDLGEMCRESVQCTTRYCDRATVPPVCAEPPACG